MLTLGHPAYLLPVRNPEKGINIKNFARNPPPTPKGPLTPQILYQEKGLHEEFRGGGLGGPKTLHAEFLRVFFFPYLLPKLIY